MIKKGQVPKLLMYLAGLIFIVCSEVCAGINDGLIAYYPFNAGAYDWSGMENHGTAYGAVLTNDRFGNTDNAYSFDGLGDYINIPRTTNLEPPNQIAISLWFKANKTAGTIHRIINKKYAGTSHTVTAYIENDKLLVWVRGTNTILYHPRVDPFTDISSWHHLCFSYDGSETKLYLDNVLVDSHAMSGPIQYDEHDWTIGAYDGGSQSFNGLIDDVRIYNRSISADEVQQLYYELAGYWKFDGNATDSSGNGNNGSLSGNPSYANGVCGAAIAFDGIDDDLIVPDSPSLNPSDGITIAVWVKSLDTTQSYILLKHHQYVMAGHQAYPLDMGLYINGTFQFVSSNINVFDDVWHFIAGTWDGDTGEMKLYVDGVEVDSNNATGNLDTGSYDLRMASGLFENRNFMTLDEVHIYSRALSQSEIQSLMNECGDNSECGDDNDCGLCEKCQNSLCVLQNIGEDLKNECQDIDCASGTCNGAGACGVDPAGTACRTAVGVCDVSETCDGSSAYCPADVKSTAECRPVAGICDVAEYCDGVNNDCPADQFQPDSYECRPDSGICDVADFCSGNSADCPNNYEPNGSSCDDEQFCTLIDQCQNGQCIGSGDSCPGQMCNEPTDECVDCINDSDCEDGKLCTINRCISGNCDFTELEPDTTICRPATGPCDLTENCTGASGDCPSDIHKPDGTSCDDGLFCNGIDTCSGGTCQSPGSPCSEPTPICYEEGAICVQCYNNGHCNDNNPCTIDTCVANQCSYENAPDTTVCRQSTGLCDVAEYCTGSTPTCPLDNPQPNGTPCNDGLYCTNGDECTDGVCSSSADTCPGQGCNESTDECSTLGALINTPTNGTTVHYGDLLAFTGCSTPEGLEVDGYSWRLDDPENGFELSSNKNFSTNLLQVGQHTIYFKVKDRYEELWSAPDSVTVTVEEAIGLPDLALSRSDIKFFNSTGQEIAQADNGEQVTIEASIHNISINDTQSPVTVKLYRGESILIDSYTITAIIEGDPQGKEETAQVASINWTATEDTYEVITVEVVYENPEATLQNNQASRLFIVGNPSGSYIITVDGDVSKSSPCYGDKLTVSGTATYDWLGMPVMGAQVTVEVWEYSENGQLYTTVQGRTTAPYGNYCLSFYAPSQNIDYVIITRVNDGYITGLDNNDIILPDPCLGTDIYDLSCNTPSFGGPNVFYIPCTGFSNAKTYTNSMVEINGQIVNSGNQDFPNQDGFDVEFHSGYPSPENLICSLRIDEVTYPEIAVGQSIPVSCPEGWTPSAAGTYNIYIRIDAEGLNDQNSNNNLAFKPIQVYEERIDLRPYRYYDCRRVTGISFSKQPIVTGDPITITCNVYNGGIDSSGAFEVRFYSGDPDGCCGQLIGDPVSIPSISPGGLVQPQVQWNTSLSEGSEEIFVKVDTLGEVSEYDENNNKTSASCYVYPNTADLYVGNVTFSNYAPNPGDFINISSRIDNNGGGISDPTYVDFYVGDPDGSGVHIGESVLVESIEPFSSLQVSLLGWEVPSIGTYYIYARLQSNGRKNFRALQVYPTPQPDLSVIPDDILINAEQFILGYPINFAATIHNQSTVAEAINPRVYFYIGGIPDPLDITVIPSIPTSGRTLVPCNNVWTPDTEGFYELGVEIEPTFPQADINYENNWATASFCVASNQDLDFDSALGICDNCPDQPNGSISGTCVKSAGSPPFDIVVGVGMHLTTCDSDIDCDYQVGEFCQLSQGDINSNGIGDACECYADCDCNQKVDLADLVIMKGQFTWICSQHPSCEADCNGDGKVDLSDLVIMKLQFLRTDCPSCP